MVNTPRPAAETPAPEVERSLVSRIFHYERPARAANDTPGAEVVRLANHRENGVERTWLQRHVVDRFITHAETDAPGPRAGGDGEFVFGLCHSARQCGLFLTPRPEP